MAIAIVSTGILTVSGRLTEWWNTDPETVSSPAVTASRLAGNSLHWGTDESAVSLLAGRHPVRMERRVLSGTQDRLDAILRERLVRILETSDAASRPNSERDHPVTPDVLREFQRQEQRLLALLNELDPVESKTGVWNLYRLDRADNPIPGTFLIATRYEKDAGAKESVAAWAIGMPSGPNQWTSFVMMPTGRGQPTGGFDVTPPARAELILSMASTSGDALMVFQQGEAVPSDVDRWIGELTDQLVRAGWHQAHRWQQSPTAATAGFERGTTEQGHAKQAIEIAISFDRSNQITGTVNVINISGIELVPKPDTENTLTSNRLQKP